MIRLLSSILIMAVFISCKEDCFNAYQKYYNKNSNIFIQVNDHPEMKITLKYLPFGTFPEALQKEGMDTYYFTVDVVASTSENKNLLNKAVMAADSIFYLAHGDERNITYPDFVQPEIMGMENRLRYLVAFSKEGLSSENYLFIMEDVFFTKTKYAFPVSIEKILSLENHYCFRYDQK